MKKMAILLVMCIIASGCAPISRLDVDTYYCRPCDGDFAYMVVDKLSTYHGMRVLIKCRECGESTGWSGSVSKCINQWKSIQNKNI